MLITRSPKTVLAGSLLAAGMALGLTACGSADINASTKKPAAAAVEQGGISVGSKIDKTATVLAETSAGESQYVIAEQDGEVRVGQTTKGTLDGWQFYDVQKDVPADSIVVSAGNSPDLGDDGRADTSGQVGADVVGVDVVTNEGRTVKAAVAKGWYVAAWDGDDFSDGRTDQVFVLHLKNGETKKIGYADVASFVD